MIGDDILKYMKYLAEVVFGFELDGHLRATDRHFFGFVNDSRIGKLNRMFGEADENIEVLLNQPGLARIFHPPLGDGGISNLWCVLGRFGRVPAPRRKPTP